MIQIIVVEATVYQVKATSATGYPISKDGGANWAYSYSGMLSTSETLYVLPSYSTSGANVMWLASPSASGGGNVLYVTCYGGVGYDYSSSAYLGFRPVVSLKSKISVTKNDDGSVTLK